MSKNPTMPAAGGLPALILAAVLLGTVGVAAALWDRVQLTSPLTMTLLRMGFAVPLLFTFTWTTPRPARATGRPAWALIGALALLMAAYQSLFFLAIPLAGVTLVVVISLCSAPLFVALLSIPLFHEHLSGRRAVAVALAVGGTAILALAGDVHPAQGDSSTYLVGLLLALGSGAGYAVFILLAKVAAQTSALPRSHLLAWTFAVTLVLLVPVTLASGTLQLDLAWPAWGLAIYMGVVPTGLSYYLLQVGLQTASATTASVVMLLEPAVAAILAWWLLGEALTVGQGGGAALLLVSVVLLSWPCGPPE